jgi:N-acetyl-anhydromuramoyl-L-alanine amidase
LPRLGRRGQPSVRAWRVDAAGRVKAARQLESPNFDERPEDARVELLVIHNISLPPGQFGGSGVIDLFLNRLDSTAHPYYREIAGLRVSSHFFIRRDGELIQFVPGTKRAWHAGQSEWRGRTRCNDFSIGVELEGADDLPFADIQYERLASLATALLAAYPIMECAGHSDIARPLGRKTDPGPLFDWALFRRLLAGPG